MRSDVPPEPGAPCIAAPSFVIPGTVPENCAFLEPLVDEVALCFFETAACLEYGEADMPAYLANHALSYHVHLPLDLPETPAGLHSVLPDLVRKALYLAPRFWVLHPPKTPALLEAAVAALAEAGIAPRDILLENVGEPPIAPLLSLAYDLDMGFCLDTGHLLRLGERELLKEPLLLERTRCIHACAPDPAGSGRHYPLDTLDHAGLGLLDSLLAGAGGLETVVLELFERRGFERSLAFWNRRYGAAS
ncbi:cobamide remodeling phosphodiesterase CbiR [Oceanidesulfovibrio marinus]|uniref:cobamide remodeling phosphodiesterase CbiR n=1 Tax=Oceanidesulfovibrio marinus TaxID=370038 RepID=UPI00148AFF3F|nr:cobamide remodeling phosphodiesterase CbiR [Oceanidesulfovibrio marinus]